MLNKTQDLNRDLDLDQEQNKDQDKDQNQENPKNFWQRLKRWQKIGVFVSGFILICVILIKLMCVLPVPGFNFDRSCQNDSDCIPQSCGCLNERGARNLSIMGTFCGIYFDCFPPSACVCKNGSCTGIDDWNHYNDSVGLLTDKIEYGREEKIKLTIKNTLPEDITFNIISLEVETDKWEEDLSEEDEIIIDNVFDGFVKDIYCDCNAECKKLPLSVEANSNKNYLWNQKTGLCDELPIDKKLRFKITLWDNSYIYYSNEFTIKKIATDISDWQTYRNEEFGFEMKYPEEWKEDKNKFNDLVVFLSPESQKTFSYSVQKNQARISVQVHTDKNMQEEIDIEKLGAKIIDKNVSIIESEIFINGIKARQTRLLYQMSEDNWYLEISTYLNYKNNLYIIHLLLNSIVDQNIKEETINIYNSFLSTFKFIDQNTNIEDIIQGGKEIEYLTDFKFENLPNYVFPEQKGAIYKLENYIFQFINQRNLNTPLPISDNDIKWAGVLYSEDNGSSWSDFFVIDNPTDYNDNEVKYNPVGMFMKNNKLYLDISDDRGAGSGEGNLLRYYTEDGEIWTRDSCLYLIPELYFNGSDGIDPFTITGNSDCVYSPVSLCDDEPFGTAIGGNVYPIDLKYKKLHFLGQLFTAADCGQERLSQIDGVDGENYILGPRIVLKNNPSQELVNVFKSIGFNCCDKVLDDECKEWSHDNYSIKISELLKLEPYHKNFNRDDCINCG
ncbi:MAG: hypothetical protein KAQ87_03970 [Candidatus Pacebacteria bacterium]|nr:hypothetical protein [Candidatus Paceibacterota bacterium]